MKWLNVCSLILTLPLTIFLPTFNGDRLSNFGTAPAIAQIFPDISDPKIQLYLQGDSFATLGFTEEAIIIYEQLLQGLRNNGDRQEEARFLHSIASSFQLRGDLQRALTYYEQALAIAEDIPPDPRGQFVDLNAIANTIGSIYLALGENEQAVAAYERAVAIDQKFDLDWQGVGTLSKLGTAHRLTGNLEQALATYQQGISLAEETKDNYYKAEIFNKIGMIHQVQGQFELALDAYQQGLAAVEDQPKEYQIVDRVLTLENLSSLYRSQGQTDKAATYDQQAQTAIAQASAGFYGSDSPARGAEFLEEIGEFYLLDGQPKRAKEYFDRAVAIVQPMSDDYRELNLLNSILVNYRKWGQFAASIPYQQLQIQRIQKMGLFDNSATSLFGLGELYQAVGQNESALTAYQQALEFYQGGDREYGGQTENLARTLGKIGSVYEAQGNPEAAITAYEQALDLYPEKPEYASLQQVYILEALARIYLTQGQDEQAATYSQQAQTIRSSMSDLFY